jgi:hypothetical protein
MYRAFAIAVFNVVDSDKKIAFVKWITKIDPDSLGQWDNNELGGFIFQGGRTLKNLSGFKPTNLLPTQTKFANPRAILNALKTNLQNADQGKQIYQDLETLVNTGKFEFSIPASKTAAIRDDLGEIIGPIMLWMNKIPQTDAAKRALLKGKSWNSCSIEFPNIMNAGLVDSYLVTPDGVRIGISSKGNKGATASVSNIYDGIETLRDQNSDLLKKAHVKKLEKLIDILVKEKTRESPLTLGITMGLITQDQAQAIRDSFEKNRFERDQLKRKLKASRKFDSSVDPLKAQLDSGPMKLASDIQNSEFYQNQTVGYTIGFHALAMVAKAVVEKINQGPDFSRAALDVLNSSSLIQLHMYTKFRPDANKTTGKLTLDKWEVIFPMEFTGKLEISSEKSYWFSGQKGRMTFKYS